MKTRLTYWLIALCLLAAARLSAGAPAAVAVCGPELHSGQVFGSGETVANAFGAPAEAFLFTPDCRMLVLAPGLTQRLPEAAAAPDSLFGLAVEALGWFEGRYARLIQSLSPEQAEADTVEAFLVYPLGAVLLDIPEAFKWQGDSLECRFTLRKEGKRRALYSLSTRDGRVKSAQYDSLLQLGEVYRWSVHGPEAADSSWFGVLDDNGLVELGALLERLESLEQSDPGPDGKVPFGWVWLKVALLSRRGLYYEARSVVRTRRELYPEDTALCDSLLHRVRLLQRRGDPS
ncbi:hypothetical protein LLH00_05545 [bacterium]|nr:hypothetical protein [bacterium]